MNVLTNPQQQPRVTAQERADEVQIAKTKDPSQIRTPEAPAHVDRKQFEKHIGAPTASRANPGTGSDSLFASKRIHDGMAVGGLQRSILQKELTQLVGTLEKVGEKDGVPTYGYSKAAVQRFLNFLDTRAVTPEAKAWAISKLRSTIPTHRIDFKELRKGLNERGYKLFRNDKLPDGHPGIYVDRRDFRAEIKRLAKKGAITERDLRGSGGKPGLLVMLKNVVDTDDLFWAQWQIRRELGTSLSGGAAERLDRIFEEKVGNRANRHELHDAVVRMRKEDFSPASVRAFQKMVEKNTDPDAAFKARQYYQSAFDKAIKDFPKREEELKGYLTNLDAMVEAQTEGYLDRDPIRRSLHRMYREGKISIAQAAAMRAAAATSRTPEQYSAAVMTVQVELFKAQTMMMMLEMWDSISETIAENMVERDEETLRYVRELEEKKRFKSQVEFQREVQEALAHHSWERAARTTVDSAISQARSPEEYDSLVGEQADIASSAAAAPVPTP